MEKLRAAARAYLNEAASCQEPIRGFAFADEVELPANLNELCKDVERRLPGNDQLQVRLDGSITGENGDRPFDGLDMRKFDRCASLLEQEDAKGFLK